MKFYALQIGSLKLRNNLIAAPMAGLSSLPYRILAMECGCALAISEMVSAESILQAHERSRRYFTNDERTRPFGVQIFGANPKAIYDAIKKLEGNPIDLIDINMGCPVKKVVNKGAGAALMLDPKNAAQIVRAARKATDLPVTVKIRSGWNATSINCVEAARALEDAGANAITIHPRTRQQNYTGKADWNLIGEAKAAVRIPVIGNGDVRSREDALRMLKQTGCDGVMIGRAAVGNPWLFREILDEEYKAPNFAKRGETALRHFDLLCELIGEKLAILNMRQILPTYAKGRPGVKRLREKVHKIDTAAELGREVELFFELQDF
ncbi:MAG: tRNA dihydrouridine synthase DusB [Pseudomonadota bacterium]